MALGPVGCQYLTNCDVLHFLLNEENQSEGELERMSCYKDVLVRADATI